MTTESLPRLGANARDKDIRLFRVAVERAKKSVGEAVFNFQNNVIQRALIAAEVLSLLNEQDDSISDARVREMALVLDSLVQNW